MPNDVPLLTLANNMMKIVNKVHVCVVANSGVQVSLLYAHLDLFRQILATSHQHKYQTEYLKDSKNNLK